MSDLFEDEPRPRPPARSSSRRSRVLVITSVVVVLAFFGLSAFANVYTERLWYVDVGFSQVFSTMLFTRVGLFLIFGLLMALAVVGNMVLAYRLRPLMPPAHDPAGLQRYRDAITPIRLWLVIGVGAMLTVFAGASASTQWRTYLLWRNRVPFGEQDPYFGRDVGFYVFELPWLHFLIDFLMAAAVVAVLGAVLVHYIFGSIRLSEPGNRLSGAAQAQLSVLVGLFVAAKGADYYLDRFDLVHDGSGLITGLTFTDDNAVIPAKNILIGIAVICAILFFLNVWRRTWLLPSMGLALMALSAVLLGMIWPGIVQQFQVRPSEPDREREYIEKNMASTRAAYGLDDVERVEFDNNSDASEADQQLAANLASQLSSVPLVDPQLVQPTFEQQQQARAYYSVAPVLDVAHYNMNGEDRALVLGAREIDQDGLNAADQNWNNLHTVYTHGSGLIAAYANQRGPSNAGATETKAIRWAEGNEPGQNHLSQMGEGYEQRIYFGEQSPAYSIVGKPSEDAEPVELGLVTSGADQERMTTYDGDGGVDIGSTFKQILYGIRFGEINFLLSERVHHNSEILYHRTPQERVNKVAPWLTIDGDAYPTIVDGKVKWVVDAYTTTDKYPGAELESLSTMLDDSLEEDAGLRALPTDEINYMRNSVKATVDAYDGTVELYQWDEDDPIVEAWQSAFPDSVQDRSEIPDELMRHLRYPEDMFKVQRYQLAKYHVTDPNDFYQANDRWNVPPDPNATGNLQPPYRYFVNQQEAGTQQAWAITSAFVPREKNNLAAVMTANSDARSSDYGKLELLDLTDEVTDGPGLVFNQISQDDAVRNELLPYEQSGSPVRMGNLLVLPLDHGLAYVEPIYAITAGAATGYPILQYVVVYYDGEVGIGETLSVALSDALGVNYEAGGGEQQGAGDGGQQGGEGQQGGQQGDGDGEQLTVDQRITRALDRADEAFANAEQALADGDLSTYQEEIRRAQNAVNQAISLADEAGQGNEQSGDENAGEGDGESAGEE